MSTRFYLPSSGPAAITPSSWSGGWFGSTGSVGPFALITTKINSALTNVTLTPATGVNQYHAAGRWVSAPLQSQTIDGTLTGVIRAVQSSAGATGFASIAVKVIKPDTTDRGIVRAVTSANLANSHPPEIDITTPSTRQFEDSNESEIIALSAVAAQAGDRLVIEIGSRINANGTNSVTLRYGDTGNDFAHTDGLTTDLAPWVEFSGDIAFSAVGSPHYAYAQQH